MLDKVKTKLDKDSNTCLPLVHLLKKLTPKIGLVMWCYFMLMLKANKKSSLA